jgi:hypothetical protein
MGPDARLYKILMEFWDLQREVRAEEAVTD